VNSIFEDTTLLSQTDLLTAGRSLTRLDGSHNGLAVKLAVVRARPTGALQEIDGCKRNRTTMKVAGNGVGAEGTPQYAPTRRSTAGMVRKSMLRSLARLHDVT
jgi:hypothetical protein